jgi:hypothetical protein
MHLHILYKLVFLYQTAPTTGLAPHEEAMRPPPKGLANGETSPPSQEEAISCGRARA